MSVEHKNDRSSFLKNAGLAPIILFDAVPAYGVLNSLVQVELGACIRTPLNNGGVTSELMCSGHLRCSPQAAASLRDALDKALALLKPGGEPKPKPEASKAN